MKEQKEKRVPNRKGNNGIGKLGQGRERLRHSLVFKIVILVIIAVVPINLLAIVMTDYTLKMLARQFHLVTEATLDIQMSQLDSVLDRFSTAMFTLVTSDEHVVRIQKKVALSPKEQNQEIFAVTNYRDQCSDLLQQYSWLTAVFTWFPEKELFINTYSNNHRENFSYYTACHDQIRSMCSDPESLAAGWHICEIDGVRQLLWLYKDKRIAFGSRINVDHLLSVWTQSLSEKQYCFELVNKENLEAYIQENEFQYELTYTLSKQADIALVLKMNHNTWLDSMPAAIRIFQGAALLSLIAVPMLLLFLKKLVLAPIRRLDQAMNQVEQGNLDFRVDEQPVSSEFENLNRNFNQMITEVQALKIDNYEKELERQSIRMKYLSQQIQPHFILNTLSILQSYEPEDYPLIQKMILCLARYFRYIVKVNAKFVTLGQELAHIRNYFDIQKARYPDRFYYIIEYEDGLEQCLIPPLIIQNFAENSIKFALREQDKINIYVIVQKTDASHIRIRIADTGDGLTPELLKEIEEFQRTKVCQKHLGVGIQNAIERLEILYSGNMNISIYNDTLEHGATVDITMPLHYKAEED